MEAEYANFKQIYAEVKSELDVAFKSIHPVYLSTPLSFGSRIAVLDQKCFYWGTNFTGHEKPQYVSSFEKDNIIFCDDCLSDEAYWQENLYEMYGILTFNYVNATLPRAENLAEFYRKLYLQTTQLPSQYKLSRDSNLTSTQRVAVARCIRQLEEATWTLSQTHTASLGALSSESAYLAYDINTFHKSYSSFAGVYKDSLDGVNFNLHETGLFGTFLGFPKITAEELWVVEVPKNVADLFLVENLEVRELNITKLPTEEEMLVVQALISDDMSVSDAVETAVALS